MGLFEKLGGFFGRDDKSPMENQSTPSSVNSSTGLPMTGNMDVSGNPFGSSHQSGGFLDSRGFSDPFSNGF